MASEGEFPKSDGDILYASEVNSFLRVNFAKGLTPTLAGTWDTNPTNLTNITDEDDSTVTTTGEANDTNTAYIKIDLGANELHHFVYCKFDYVVSSGNADFSYLKIQTSTNDSDWVDISGFTTGQGSNGTFNIDKVEGLMRTFRYIRIKVENNQAGSTSDLDVYELAVY